MILHENIRRLLTPEQRREIGQPTIEESKAKGTARIEKDLQLQIIQDLHRRGFVVVWHRTDRRTTTAIGLPDILFSHYGRSVAYEVKTPSGRLSIEQTQQLRAMANPPNGWTVAVIRSFDEYLAELHKLYVK